MPAGSPYAPGQYNTFIPNTDATNGLVVDFSRNVADFALPRWVQYVPVQLNKGFYIEMTVEMAGRLLNDDGRDMMWADGAEAPSQTGNQELFEFKPYQTQRFAPGFHVGEIAAEQAAWDILAQSGRIQAQRAMTLRTARAVAAATTTAVYPSGHVIDMDSLPAGLTGASKWDAADTTDMSIKRCLDYGASLIQIATLSAVKPSNMMLVINPTTARLMAIAQEMRDHIKQSPFSRKSLESNLGPHDNYGLTDSLYDYEVVIEDTVKVSTRKGETTAKSYVLADGDALLVSRVGGLEGVEGAPSFSSITAFLKTEMVVETKHDRDNKRHLGRVIDDHDVVVTSPISSVYFQNVLS